jgi:hypothetical protein
MSFAVTSLGAAHGSGFAEESAVVAGAGVAAAGVAEAGVVVGALGAAGVALVVSVDGVAGAAGVVGAEGVPVVVVVGSVGAGFEPPQATAAAARKARQSVFISATYRVTLRAVNAVLRSRRT